MKGALELFDSLRRRWGLVAAATAGGLLAGVAVNLLVKPLYRATAVVKLDLKRRELSFLGASPLPQRSVDPIQSQLELLRSRSLAKRVVLRLGLCLKVEGEGLSVLAKGVDSSIRVGEYSLRWGERAELLSEGRVIAGANRGDTLRGPGFWLVLTWEKPGEGRVLALSPDDVAEELRRKCSCVQRGKTDFASISCASRDPQEAARVANALAEAYVEASLDAAREQARLARDFIEEQLRRTEAELKRAEDALRRFKEEEGMVEASAAAQNILEALANLDRALADARVQEAVCSRRLNALRAQLRDSTSPFGEYRSLAAEPGLSANPKLVALSQALDELVQRRASLLAELSPLHPDVVAVDRQIEEVKAKMRELAREAYRKGPSASDLVLQYIYRDLVEAQVGLQVARAQIAALEREIAAREEELRSFPEKEQRLAQLERRAEAGRRIYEDLLEKLQEAKIEEAKQITEARVIDRAMVPKSPVRPKVWLNLLLGLFLGFVFGVSGVYVLERLEDTVKDPRAFERALEDAGFESPPRFLGVVPVARDGDGLVSDALRFVAVNALHFSEGSKRVFLITSPEPSTGKSFLATRLAESFAEMGKRVLVVDADLRKPVQHLAFGASSRAPGLAEVLGEGAGLEEAIREVLPGKVFLLPSGRARAPLALALLVGEKFKELMENLGERFDVVLVDSAPLGVGSPEAIELASRVPWVMLVVRYARTRTALVVDALKTLVARGSNVLGFVVNFYEFRGLSRYYYYYRYKRYETPKRRGFAGWLTKWLRG